VIGIVPRDLTSFLLHILFMVPALLLGLVLHELAHAAVATAQGDPTPRNQGRLSLDPRRHLHPWGTIMVFVFGFGFANPVQINPGRLRGGLARFFVAIAGPAANLTLAVLASIPLRLLADSTPAGPQFHASCSLSASPDVLLQTELFYIYALNLFLVVFNLLPVPGLDGFEIVRAILRTRNPRLLFQIEMNRQGIMLVLVFVFLFFAGVVFGMFHFVIGPIANILGPPAVFPCSAG
jgi:Zn-dependent protease